MYRVIFTVWVFLIASLYSVIATQPSPITKPQLTQEILGSQAKKKVKSTRLYQNVTPEDSIIFPKTLENLTVQKHLPGGSGGVNVMQDEKGQVFTLKCVSDQTHFKEEITADALYRSLGLKTPAFAVYNQLPTIPGLKCPAQGLYRLAKFIPSNKQDHKILTEEMKKGFVADAYLSNWDIVVDNFKNVLMDTQNQLWRIDNGGALRYTSLGKPKKEIPSWTPHTVSELETLRDPKGNADGAKVYSGITQEQIKQQVTDLVAHRETMMKTLDDLNAAIHIDNLPELKQILRERMDALVKTFEIHVAGAPAGVASTIHPMSEHTAAGILVYSYDPKTKKPVVLMGQRIHHNWWSNFGGTSDKPDQELSVTAAREVDEESFGLIYFVPHELNKMPSHDIKNSMGVKYRMYIAPYKYIPVEEFGKRAKSSEYSNHVEYTDFRWVPVEDLFRALTENKVIVEENEKTITVDGIVLYHVFWEMLKEPQVMDLLKKIQNKKPLGSAHTTQKGMEASRYLTVEQEKRELAETSVAHGKVIAELKDKRQPAPEVASPTKQALAALPYTQSQAHLAIELGKETVDQNLNNPQALVTAFLKRYSSSKLKDEHYVETMAKVLAEEMKQRGMVVFYHATDPLSSFLFDVYSAFRAQMKTLSPDKLTVLRGHDTHFRTLADVNAFIQRYTQNESLDNANVVEGVPYAELGLSTNFFEFGSNGVGPSETYTFFFNTESMAPPPFDSIFQAFAKETGIQADLDTFKRLYKQYYRTSGNNAKLYQIFIDPTVVDQVAYLSLTAGKLLNVKLDDGSSYHGFREIIGEIRSDLPKFVAQTRHGVNDLQARLFMKPEVFHDPKFVNIQTYWRFPIDEKAYKKQLDALISQTLVKTLQEQTKSSEHAFAEGKPALKRIHEEATKGVTGLPYVAKEKSIKSLPEALEDEDYQAIEANLAKMTPKQLNGRSFFNPKDKYDRQTYSLLDLLSDKSLQNIHLLEMLKEKGFDLKARTSYGKRGLRETLMEKAASKGFLPTVEFLVKAEIDMNEVGGSGTPNKTPLTLAARNGHLNVVKYLAGLGASLDKSDPLFEAVGSNQLEVVRYLLTKGLDVNALARTYDQGLPVMWSPLYIACKKGYLDLAKFLVEKGADLNFKTDNNGETLLHAAALEGHLNIAQFLVEKGADVNAKTNRGDTPLYQASRWGKTNVVGYLVTVKGIDINAKNNAGDTVLKGVKEGLPDYFREALIKRNKELFEPRLKIVDEEKPKIIKILEDYGARG